MSAKGNAIKSEAALWRSLLHGSVSLRDCQRLRPVANFVIILELGGKTSGLDHSWPDNIDHLKPELSICCLAMYINCNLPGEMWSISPAFALISCFN